VFELAEEALDQVALAVEPLGEARLPFAVGFCGNVGRGALLLDQRAEAISVISLVGQHDRAGAEMIEQLVGDLAVMRLAGGQAEPDREALRVDDGVDFGREPAARATETVISTPLFAVAACGWTRTEVLSII
jgi:hypothetical protein